MNNPGRSVVLIFLSFFSIAFLEAQPITGYVVSPTPVLECNNTQVTINGFLPCGNATIQGTGHTIVGNTLFVDVFILQPLVCLPIILPYSVTEIVGNIPAGSYTITIRYFQNGLNLASMSGALSVASCCSVNSGFIASSLTGCPGGSLLFTANDTTLSNYSWSVNGNAISSDSVTGYTFPATGTYNISLTAGNGTCSTSTAQSVVISQPQTSFAQIIDESCPGTQNGSINLQVSGGILPYTYLWSNGSTSQDLTQLSAGTYSVTVTDAIGCVKTDSTTVSAGTPVVAGFTSASFYKLCTGESALFTSNTTGATQYSWTSNGTLFSQNPVASYTFTDTGVFIITLIAANITCSDSVSQLFYVSAPMLSATTTDETCNGTLDGAIDLSVIAGIFPYTFSWSNGSTDEDPAQLGAGNYTVTVTDSLGCATTDTFAVGNSIGILAQFSASGPASICPGDSISFSNTSTAGVSSTWLSDGIPFASTQDASFVFPDSGTTAISLIVNLLACADTATTIFTINEAPEITAQLTGETCPDSKDGAISLNLSGGAGPFVFDWSNGESTEDLEALAAGQYELLLTFGPSCKWRDTFEVAKLGGLSADFFYQVFATGILFTDKSDTTATSWSWDFGDGSGSSILQNPFYEYTLKGDYQVCLTVTDSFGCTDTLCGIVTWTAGLEDREKLNIKGYPNPVQHEYQLDMSSIAGKPVRIQLYDLAGRLILSREENAEHRTLLQFETLSAGIYQLIILTENGYFEEKIRKE
ncbi:MAG: PKD domain-containing protein [Bacteroidia bacterium]|nr:PKD domain-containing protein [Bacteroidia bacterium]